MPLGPTTERLNTMWTILLLFVMDPETSADTPAMPEAVAYECPDSLVELPDLVQRECRKALALQASPSAGAGTRPVIILPAAAAAAAGIALAGLKGDPPVSR